MPGPSPVCPLFIPVSVRSKLDNLGKKGRGRGRGKGKKRRRFGGAQLAQKVLAGCILQHIECGCTPSHPSPVLFDKVVQLSTKCLTAFTSTPLLVCEIAKLSPVLPIPASNCRRRLRFRMPLSTAVSRARQPLSLPKRLPVPRPILFEESHNSIETISNHRIPK